MRSLRIVIPSHKRHDRVFAKYLVNDPIICVAKSQADLYKQFNPDCEIVTHPDDVVGLIPKRNWMAKHFRDLFMLDDDVDACKKLYTISAEDCWGLITHEIDALHNGYELVNKGSKEPKGRIFIGKAIILLCECYKSRDADHLNNLAVDKLALNDNRVLDALDDARREPLDVPEYTYDIHTAKGRKMGKTKQQFFHDEHHALSPRLPGLFDDLVP